MNEQHYKEQLSLFVNHELAHDERQAIAEHLLRCAECRAEHDEIKFGAALAERLPQTDAPEDLWRRIEESSNGTRSKVPAIPNLMFFNLRGLTVAAAFLAVAAVSAAIYFGYPPRDPAPQTARTAAPFQNPDAPPTPTVSTPGEAVSDQGTIRTADAASDNAPEVSANRSSQPQNAQSDPGVLPKNAPAQTPRATLPLHINPPSWNVETLSGMPRIGNSSGNEKLAVGEVLETDAASRARVQVANIGNVEVAPNSRVKLVGTRSTEHRLALEKGALKAKILAPPRLFIVDTPSAVAVDLGCEYTLEVDQDGNSKLHVTSGFVALENGKYESIVPAGAMALTRKGKGVGTPFSEDASANLQSALYRFDFEQGGSAALQTIISESGLYDSVTLWHLLRRVENAERAKVFDALRRQVKPPAGVTRDGILRLDKKMLDDWWTQIETVWFE